MSAPFRPWALASLLATGSLHAQEASRCEAIALSDTVRSPEESPDVPFRRCGTYGGERDWDTLISADHRYLAARANTGIVHLIDTQTWREVVQLTSALGEPAALAFSPDGALLAMLSGPVLSLWSTHDGTLARTISFEGRAASGRGALAFSADGTRIATSLAATVDLRTGAVLDWNHADKLLLPSGFTSNLLGYEDVRFADAERQLLLMFSYRFGSSNFSRGLFLMHPDTGAFSTLRTGWGWVSSNNDYQLSPDGTRVLVGGSPGTQLYDAHTGQPAVAAFIPGSPLGFSPDSRRLYALVDATLRTHDAGDGALLGERAWPGGAFRGVAPGGQLVTATPTHTVWVAPDGTHTRSLDVALRSVRWSADGALFVSSSADALLRVHREADGSELCKVPMPDGPPASLAPLVTRYTDVEAIDPPAWGSYVVSTSADGAIAAVLVFDGHQNAVDWSHVQVVDRRTGTVLRSFPSYGYRRELSAVVSLDGSKVYTWEDSRSRVPYIAVWCR